MNTLSISNSNDILDNFNKTFLEFIEYIINVIEDNKEIKNAHDFFKICLLKKSSIIKIWHNNVYLPYKEYIDNGDIIYFLNKDYNDDLNIINEESKNKIIDIINKLREPIKKMKEIDFNNSCQYIKNLSILSSIYTTINTR